MSTHSSSSSFCFRSFSGRRRHSPPPTTTSSSGYPNLTTSFYHTNFALFYLTWSRSLLSRSLHLHFHQNPNPFHSPPPYPSFHLHLKPFFFWKKLGFKKLSSSVHVFWDLTLAKFSHAPEPHSGFYVAVVVDREMILLVGDLVKEAYEKTRAVKSQNLQSIVLKREHVIAHKIYSTKAKFGGKVRDIQIDCGYFNFNDDSSLCFSVDQKRVLEIKRLEWKFRGNEIIEVEGVSVQIFWDVYNWVFKLDKKENAGNAVFVFRFEEEEQSESLGQQKSQTWNLGMNELEWRKMRSSLSSSSMSMSSVGSSAVGSCSVMEWANMEENDFNGGPSGFSLLVYAWRK